MLGLSLRRRARGLESPEVLSDWSDQCAAFRASVKPPAAALETLDDLEADLLDVATYLRAEGRF